MTSRRTVRQTREFLYRKSLEGKQRAEYEKKRKLRQALETGAEIPTELRGQVHELKEGIFMDDTDADLKNSIDDEYAKAGIEDPRVFITTSLKPSSRLKQFVKELKLLFPGSMRMNRGSYGMKTLMNACRKNNVTDLILAHETRGEPDGFIVCHLPYGPTAYFSLSGTILRHDIETKTPMSQAFPHLIFDNFTTGLGARVQNVLKYLFPVPKHDSKRVITFSNREDYISFRHHTYEKRGKEVELKEIGPRFELRLFRLVLGTLDMPAAKTEWALRPYMNSAHKRTYL